MLILPKICYKSTFLHRSNILIEIPCNNVQFFTFLLNPFQIFSCSFSFFFFPAFLFSFLSTLHILLSGSTSLDKIIGKPWKGDVDQLQVCWPVYAPILHQKRSLFFSISSIRMQSGYSKCMVLWKDQSTLCQLLIWKVDWRVNWWRHKWFNDHSSKCRQKSTFALKGLNDTVYVVYI